MDALFKLTVEIHNNYMATSVLHDMESYNWKDSKEFQEVNVQIYSTYPRSNQALIFKCDNKSQAILVTYKY